MEPNNIKEISKLKGFIAIMSHQAIYRNDDFIYIIKYMYDENK